MMMTAAPRLMTAREYFATPESLAPRELAFGVLRVADSPAPRHQSVVAALMIALDQHVRERSLGTIWISPLDVVLDANKALIVQPDLMFISNERAEIVGTRIDGPPDLVIEILSPRPRVGKLSEHLSWYAEYGVRECWAVHQDQQRVSVTEFGDCRIRAQRMNGGDDAIRSSLLPDFALSLRQILDAQAVDT
jgi:Uma2 family endonuclease